MCDIGRASYKQIAVPERITVPRLRREASWQGAKLPAALDAVASWFRGAGKAAGLIASPQGTNEDLFAFRALADLIGARLDFRVGDPQLKLWVRSDDVLLREDRNPNTHGCLDLGLDREGIPEILEACSAGMVRALLLQGPELLRLPEAAAALDKVPFIAVMATHEGPELALAHAVLPAAVWAEVDGTFTNYQRRVQRIKKVVPAPGDAKPRWELAAGLMQRLGGSFSAMTPREIFTRLVESVPDYTGLDYKALGSMGQALSVEEEGTAQEARS